MNVAGGFSLLEMLIVFAIVGILVTLSYGYLISAKPHAQLEQAEITLQALMTKARNLSISEERVMCGWGKGGGCEREKEGYT